MHAARIVAGSDNEVSNLSIAMMVKKLNPSVFVVIRQNHAASDVLFDTFRADFRMVHTRVVAQECLSILTTPLLTRFLSWPTSGRELEQASRNPLRRTVRRLHTRGPVRRNRRAPRPGTARVYAPAVESARYRSQHAGYLHRDPARRRHGHGALASVGGGRMHNLAARMATKMWRNIVNFMRRLDLNLI